MFVEKNGSAQAVIPQVQEHNNNNNKTLNEI